MMKINDLKFFKILFEQFDLKGEIDDYFPGEDEDGERSSSLLEQYQGDPSSPLSNTLQPSNKQSKRANSGSFSFPRPLHAWF